MNNNEGTARIIVEVTEPDAEGKVEVDIELDGKMNTLLNGLAKLNAHFIKTLTDDLGKELGMHVYSAVQIDALEECGIDPEKEMRDDAARTLALIGRIFADDDPEEEAEQNESV